MSTEKFDGKRIKNEILNITYFVQLYHNSHNMKFSMETNAKIWYSLYIQNKKR